MTSKKPTFGKVYSVDATERPSNVGREFNLSGPMPGHKPGAHRQDQQEGQANG